MPRQPCIILLGGSMLACVSAGLEILLALSLILFYLPFYLKNNINDNNFA